MAIQDLKFTEAEFVGEDISSLPDQVVGQAAFLKAKFDNIGKNKVALGKFNDLIDELGANNNGVNAEKLNGQPPEYYLPAEKLAAVTNGTIAATGMGDPQHAYWQNRSGWVHLSVWWIAQADQGAAIAQINGGNGLPNSAITVKGMVRYKDSGEVAMGLYRIDANGQIVVTNGAGAMMSEGWLDVTIPAKNV